MNTVGTMTLANETPAAVTDAERALMHAAQSLTSMDDWPDLTKKSPAELAEVIRRAYFDLDAELPKASPSPATVDVGEARRIAGELEAMSMVFGEPGERAPLANGAKVIRSLASALETEQAKGKGLASPVMSLLTMYDAGRLEMSSEEYPGEEPQGPDDPGVPAHPIHDELVWALREAVAQLRPVTTEKE